MKKVLILNGPNLNLLHLRNKSIYGSLSLEKIHHQCLNLAKEIGIELAFEQSNSEGELINFIHKAINFFDGIIINPGAYTHTSIAIRDALEIFEGAKIELHISNIFKREKFRQHSYCSEVVDAVICGFGSSGYLIALHGITKLIETKN